MLDRRCDGEVDDVAQERLTALGGSLRGVGRCARRQRVSRLGPRFAERLGVVLNQLGIALMNKIPLIGVVVQCRQVGVER